MFIRNKLSLIRAIWWLPIHFRRYHKTTYNHLLSKIRRCERCIYYKLNKMKKWCKNIHFSWSMFTLKIRMIIFHAWHVFLFFPQIGNRSWHEMLFNEYIHKNNTLIIRLFSFLPGHLFVTIFFCFYNLLILTNLVLVINKTLNWKERS